MLGWESLIRTYRITLKEGIRMIVICHCKRCGEQASVDKSTDDFSCSFCGAYHTVEWKGTDEGTFRVEATLDPAEPLGGSRSYEEIETTEWEVVTAALLDMVQEAQREGEPLSILSIAETFDVRLPVAVQLVEDLDLCLNVGIQAGGLGGPVGNIPMDQWTVEDLSGPVLSGT